jgi:hypothetical protein
VIVGDDDRAHRVERTAELRECAPKLVVIAGEAAIDDGDSVVDDQIPANPLAAEPIDAVREPFARAQRGDDIAISQAER